MSEENSGIVQKPTNENFQSMEVPKVGEAPKNYRTVVETTTNALTVPQNLHVDSAVQTWAAQEAQLERQLTDTGAPLGRSKWEALQEQQAAANALESQLAATRARISQVESEGAAYQAQQLVNARAAAEKLAPVARAATATMSEIPTALADVERHLKAAQEAAARLMIAVSKHENSYDNWQIATRSVRDVDEQHRGLMMQELRALGVSASDGQTNLPPDLDAPAWGKWLQKTEQAKKFITNGIKDNDFRNFARAVFYERLPNQEANHVIKQWLKE